LEGLDRQVDLAVLLDGDDLRLDDVRLPEVFVDVLDVVAVDLGDVDEPDLPALEGQEGPVRGDAADGPLDDRADFELCQCPSPPRLPAGASPGAASLPSARFGRQYERRQGVGRRGDAG